MTRHMTEDEATAMVQSVFQMEPEEVFADRVEVTVWNYSAEQAQADLDSFIAWINTDIDPESIKVSPDRCDDPDSPAAKIVVRIA